MIYSVLPTRNRLACLQKNIECLRQQTIHNRIVVIDDGSMDGTNEWLKSQKDIYVINGNGDLWWTGAMRLGIEYILSIASNDDLVLTMNDDAEFNTTFLKILVKCHEKLGNNSIIGSVCFSDRSHQNVINSGAWISSKPPLPENHLSCPPLAIDLLSGKGTLIPIKTFAMIGNFDKALPHYGADYEFSYRAKKRGFQPYICYQAEIFNQRNDGGLNEIIAPKSFSEWKRMFFSKSSKRNWYYKSIYAFKTRGVFYGLRSTISNILETQINLLKMIIKSSLSLGIHKR